MRQQMLPLRLATMGDKEKILPLMLLFKEESAYKDLPTEEEVILQTIEDYLNRDKKDTIIVIATSERSEEAIGLIVGTSSKLPFNNQLQCAETIWYVKPEYRGSDIGLMLYQAFLHWATNIVKADVIHTAAPKGSGLDKIYKREGYTLLEQLYIKVL